MNYVTLTGTVATGPRARIGLDRPALAFRVAVPGPDGREPLHVDVVCPPQLCICALILEPGDHLGVAGPRPPRVGGRRRRPPDPLGRRRPRPRGPPNNDSGSLSTEGPWPQPYAHDVKLEVMAVFDSKQVRLAVILAVAGVLVGGGLLVGWYEGSRSADAVRRDRAAIEAAAGRLTYDELAAAWQDTTLGDTEALAALEESIGVDTRTVYQDGDAIILVFASGYGSDDVCIDLVARPAGTTVDTRDC